MKNRQANIRKSKSGVEYEVTEGNVFAELGLPEAEDAYLKSQLLVAILRHVEANNLTQVAVAQATGLTQPNVSLLLNGKLRGFSVERLFTILNRLGLAVEVRVVDHSGASACNAAATTTVKVPAVRRSSSARHKVKALTSA